MPTIPQYISQRTAGDVGGGAYINPNAAAPVYEGLRQVAGGIDNAVEVYLKHRDETERALAYNELNNFHDQARDVVKRAKSLVAEAAVETENKPGVTVIADQEMDKIRQNIINNYTGSRKNKLLLDQALLSQKRSFYNEVFDHEIRQKGVLNARSLDASARTLISEIKLGNLTASEASVKMNNQIDALYPDQKLDSLKNDYFSKFNEQWESYRKDRKVTEAIVDLKVKYGDDIQAAIKEAESPEFISKHGEALQRTVVASLTTDWRRREDAYKLFANEKVGAASNKIYEGQAITDDDLEGLRETEIAVINRIKDYQVRQDRADMRADTQEKRLKRQEEKIEAQEKSDELFSGVLERIVNGEYIDPIADIYSLIPKGLLKNDRNELIRIAGKSLDPNYKLGIDAIKKSIFDPVERARAVKDFYEQVRIENAHGDRIIGIAENIIKPKKEGIVKRFLDYFFSNDEEELSQEDLEYTAKKYGITVDEVKRRLNAR